MTEDERRDHTANQNILASVNAAINRAGIHYAVTFAEAIDRIAAERDRAVAECQRLKQTIVDLRRHIKDAFR